MDIKRLLPFLVLVGAGPLFAADVVINELMSSNQTTIADEDGDWPDWIELFNSGAEPVNVTGWGLSDSPGDPMRWVFPSLTIDPGKRRLIFASGKDRAMVAPHNETVIRRGDRWRWMSGADAPPSGWHRPDFDDSGWQLDPSGFGFGDGDDETTVPRTLALYIRTTFTVTNPGAVQYALLHMDYDDGFVAYINGVEVARANIGVRGIPPAHSDSADSDHEARIYQGLPPELFIISFPQATLRPGANVVAIQVHNSSMESSDLTAIPFLTLGLGSAPEGARGLAEELKDALPPLHCNFSIASEGEPLILTRPDRTAADSVPAVQLFPDISIGRSPDGSDRWLMFDQPTPGTANGGGGLTMPPSPPRMSHIAGFYLTPISVSLTHIDTTFVIHYTLDGAPPDENSSVYSSPIRLDTTSVIRAAVRKGSSWSDIVTRSFIIGSPPNLPVVSLSTAPANLWDPDSGIYVLGREYDPEPPHRGANFWQDWERPIHIEFIELDGTTAFANDGGVKIHGGWTRYFPQKSLDIYFRRQYGDNQINYRLFPDLPYDSWKNFTLRNSGSDWDHTMFRDALMTSLLKGENVDIQAWRPVVVYLNGAYWGIYNIRDKLNEYYIAAHYGLDPDSVDRMEVWGGVTQGSGATYFAMIDFMENNSLADSANYARVKGWMDVDNFMTYNAANIYCDNTDWPGNNNKFWRPHYSWGLWRWFTFDLDFGFGLHDENAWNHNGLIDATAPDGPSWPNPPIATFVLRKCLESPEFRSGFINRFADLMNGPYLPERIARRIAEIRSVIEPEIPRHLARWGRTIADWEEKVAELQPFADRRPAAMRGFITDFFNLAGEAALTFNVNPPTSGELRVNNRPMNELPFSGIWFKGVPMELFAAPKPGFRFVRWSTGDREQRIHWTPTGDQTVTALFEPFATASSLIVINEISPADTGAMSAGDWVELVVNTNAHDLSGWMLKDDNDAHIYRFPDGLRVRPGDYLVLAADTAQFNILYPGAVRFVGQLNFGLRASGDQVRLFNAAGQLVDSVAFTDQPPWPTLTMDDNGRYQTLELSDPGHPNEDPQYWRASPRGGGSPGRSNIYLPPTPFRLLFPQEGDTVENLEPLLIWESSTSRADSQFIRYSLEWSASPDFSPSLTISLRDTVFQLRQMPPPAGNAPAGQDQLEPEVRIWWRVTAHDDGGLSVAGIPDSGRSFFTPAADAPPLPEAYFMGEPFPNPANNTFTVPFEMAETGTVSFRLYDIHGRLMWQSERTVAAGYHRLIFSPDRERVRLPSGLYFMKTAYGAEKNLSKVTVLR